MKSILVALISLGCVGSVAFAQQDSTTSALQLSQEEAATAPRGVLPFIGAAGGYTGYENVETVEGAPGSIKLLGSWYLGAPVVMDLGYGTAYQQFSRDEAPQSSITDGVVEFAARYRTENRWQFGVVANHMFDQGANYSADQADAQFTGLQLLKEFNMTPSWLARVGARAQALTNNTDGWVTMYMLDLQIGWNPSAYKPSTRSTAAAEDYELEEDVVMEEAVAPARPVNISEANPAPVLQDMSYAALAGGAGEINFNSSRSVVAKADQDKLAKVAQALEDNRDLFESVEVRGYTDASGNAQLNQRLSQQRADSVASVLKRNGLNDVVATGMGSQEATGNKNSDRRAELVFKGVKDQDALKRVLTQIE